MPSRRLLALIGVLIAFLVYVAVRSATDGEPRAQPDHVEEPRSTAPESKPLARPTPPALGMISGEVRAPDGSSIPGSVVCAIEVFDSVVPRCATSVEDGHYAIENLGPGLFRVAASARGYLPGIHDVPKDPLDRIALTEGENRHGVTLVLHPGGASIAGRVEDATGGPLVADVVLLVGSERRRDASDQPAAILTSTDDEGRFRIWGPKGPLRIRASADGYAPAESLVVAPHPSVVLRLLPQSGLTGVVVRADTHEPVAGAEVHAGGATQDDSPAVSDESGRFELASLEAGRYRPYAMAEDGFGVATRSVRVAVGETASDVRIELYPAAALVGTIAFDHSDGFLCRHGHVDLVPLSENVELRHSPVREGSDVQFRGILPGTYAVEVTCPDGIANRRVEELLLEPGTTHRSWTIDSGLEVSGRVRQPNRQTFERVEVSVRAAADGAVVRTWCERDGSFVLNGVTTGVHELRVSDDLESVAPRVTQELVVDGADISDVVVDLPAPTAVEGRVSTMDEDPVADAAVCAVLAEDDGSCPFHTRTAGDGSFRLALSEGGSYAMSVVGDPAGETVGVIVADGEVLSGVRLHAPARTQSIGGRVVDVDGHGVPDAFVTASGEGSGFGRPQATVITSADGIFVLAGLSPGKYALRASVRGAGEVLLESVASGSDGLELRLEPTAGIRGRVRGISPKAPYFSIAVEDRRQSVLRRDLFLSPAGTWEIPELPPGDYTIYAISGESFASSGPYEVSGDSVTDVDMTLRPFETLTGRVVDEESGSAVVGIRVLVSLDVDLGSHSVHSKDAITDAEGRFTVRAPSGGTATLTLYPVTKEAGAYRAGRFVVEPENGSVGDLRVSRVRSDDGSGT